MDIEVHIVGAGPTGLVLALWLARHGVTFRIIDAGSGPGEASRAMVVHARTLEFYRQAGFAEEAVARGLKVETIHLREGGREVATVALRDLGGDLSPYPFVLCLPQDEHERFLIERLAEAGIAVEWKVRLVSFSQGEAGVRAVLDRDGVEEVVDAAYLCGCDGAHSRVREILALDFPGGTYDRLFYVADVRLADGFRPDMFATLGTAGLAIMLPARGSGMQRFIGAVPQALAGREHVAFDEIRPAAETLMGLRVAQVNWFATYHVHHRVASHFRRGRVFLAGDAGHIHSPAGGQGMNTGIGDAVNLSWKLAHVLRGRAAEAILDTYETERIAFARILVKTTDQVFQAMVDPGWAGRLLRTWLVPRLAPRLARFASVRRWVFRTISQIRIRYRTSALSEGRAGRIQGGDRLPFVAASDNFASQAAFDWRLHVYGSADTRLYAAAERLGIPVDVYPWNAGAGRAGLAQDAAYLVRPDGHVGLALPDQDAEGLRAYALRHGIGRPGAGGGQPSGDRAASAAAAVSAASASAGSTSS